MSARGRAEPTKVSGNDDDSYSIDNEYHVLAHGDTDEIRPSDMDNKCCICWFSVLCILFVKCIRDYIFTYITQLAFHICWVILSNELGVVPWHQPLKHIVAWQQVNQYRDDLKNSSLWYQVISHYTDNLCANFEEAPGRAHKRIRYARCLTLSLHWFRLWLGAAYILHIIV